MEGRVNGTHNRPKITKGDPILVWLFYNYRDSLEETADYGTHAFVRQVDFL